MSPVGTTYWIIFPINFLSAEIIGLYTQIVILEGLATVL
jgi:hypothetical protein